MSPSCCSLLFSKHMRMTIRIYQRTRERHLGKDFVKFIKKLFITLDFEYRSNFLYPKGHFTFQLILAIVKEIMSYL